MSEILVKITDPNGLHARPASVLVSNASKYLENRIELLLEDNTIINAKSIMNVLASAIEFNQEFLIRVEGFNSEVVIREYTQFLCDKEIINIV